jgi:hypothetical protein
MLREGKAVIDEFKGDAEGVVKEVKATVQELQGLWDWAVDLWNQLAGLFGVQTKKETSFTEVAATAAPKPVAKKKKQREPEPDAELLQMQVIHDVSQQLGKFFDIQQKIQAHYKNLEEESLHVYDANQNHAMKAMERVEVELQLEELTVKIRETMVYAPRELKDLYSRFLTMYGQIKEEQEFARLEQIRNARNKRWRQEARRNFRIDLLMWAVGMAIVLSVYWWMMVQVANLSGFSMECCSLPLLPL